MLFWNFRGEGIGFVFETFENSSNERKENTNVGQTMKSFTLYRYIFLWSKALFFLVSVFTESLFIVVDSLSKPRELWSLWNISRLFLDAFKYIIQVNTDAFY